MLNQSLLDSNSSIGWQISHTHQPNNTPYHGIARPSRLGRAHPIDLFLHEVEMDRGPAPRYHFFIVGTRSDTNHRRDIGTGAKVIGHTNPS